MDLADLQSNLAYWMGLADHDQDVRSALHACNVKINSISWERWCGAIQARSEAKSKARRQAAFVARHKRVQ